MANDKKKKMLSRIDDTLKQLKNKDFTFFFFVIDSKETPNGSMCYIYRMAKELQNNGYKVKMLYQLENEYTQQELDEIKKNDYDGFDETRVFTGVTGWLGTEYSSLEHMNILSEEWNVSPSDFLFIPEVFSGMMYETFKHNIPCKRCVILQNYDNISRFIPLGVEWKNYGITDAIVSTEYNEKMLKSIFPYMKTKIVSPYISEMFRKPVEPKNLIVNIIASEQNDINRIVKPFYWKYPIYKFVSFRELRNNQHYEYAERLKESPITVWVDEKTSFGYSPLEAIKCGNVVIGKIPQNVPEWMGDEQGLFDNGIWFDNINDVPQILAKVVGSWMQDEIPEVIKDNMEATSRLYPYENFKQQLSTSIEELIEERIKEIEIVRSSVKNNDKL